MNHKRLCDQWVQKSHTASYDGQMGSQCVQGTEESMQALFASQKAMSVAFTCFKMNPAMSFACGMKIQLVNVSPKGIVGDGYSHMEMYAR